MFPCYITVVPCYHTLFFLCCYLVVKVCVHCFINTALQLGYLVFYARNGRSHVALFLYTNIFQGFLVVFQYRCVRFERPDISGETFIDLLRSYS
ncbi:MAG: hypothetical protein J6T88_09375 [Bacteroidales bacterium]|nr:hypothetical protein [Bacteroidales bacterium]